MKKNLVGSFLFTIVCPLATLSQPVLTAAGINPVLGDVYQLSRCAYTSAGSAGINQTWDLSALTPTGTASGTISTVASSAYSSQFSGNSNMRIQGSGVPETFLNASANVCQQSGSITTLPAGTLVNSDNEDLIRYPFNMNDTYTDPWAATYTTASWNISITGSSTVTFDGYGTLKLPTGTFNNVARLHTVRTSTNVNASFPTPQVFSYDEYKWYLNNHHLAIAGVGSYSVDGSFTESSSFYSADASLAIGMREETAGSLTLKAFPNPASETIYFSLDDFSGIAQLMIQDECGRIVYSEKIEGTENTATARVDQLAQGLYLVKVIAKNGVVGVQKISVAR